ncbi:MAG: hypothetical protein IJQ87_02220 [Clostridia bacterium]|nr:hypothetical protein [Clostridia bacterium]
MKRTVKKDVLTVGKVETWCTSIAKVAAIRTDSPFIINDMRESLKEWRHKHFDEFGRIYGDFYLAVRANGVESGTLQYVQERCAALGAPSAVMKISGNGSHYCAMVCNFEV